MNLPALAAVFGFVGVLLGAFGAHGLRDSVTVERMAVFETAVRYHLFHVLAALAAHLLGVPSAGIAFLVGTTIFSGSLYVLVLTDTRWLGAITPIGGVVLLVGWGLLAFAAYAGRAGASGG